MRDTWVKILGTRYKVEFKKESEDEVLKEAHGYCDITGKRIVVISEERGIMLLLQDFKRIALA